jgi:glycosyltransferase involved in cell wall biosynthesis
LQAGEKQEVAEADVPRVSVVLPVLNGDRYLAQAIESVLSQTLRDLELVIVDDGSTDRSRAIVESLAGRDDRVRLIVNEANLGLAAALNRGWQAARAPYIARLDADDVALPDRLSLQVAFLDSNPAVAVVGGASIRIDAAGNRGAMMLFPTTDRGIRATLTRRCCIPHSGAVIRKRVLEEVGGYRLGEAEDFDLWLRVADRWQLANLPVPVVLYREHAGQITNATLERQSTATVAVRAAARFRRAGLSDPLDGSERVTPEVLEQLKVGRKEIAAQVERDCLERAASYEILGHRDESAALIGQAQRTLGKGTRRRFAAAVELKRADARLTSHRPVAGVAHASLAVLNAPGYATSRLASRFRDRLYGRAFW